MPRDIRFKSQPVVRFSPGRLLKKLDPKVPCSYTGPSPISNPPHYNFGKIEVISVIEDWGLGFHLGNVIKYVARAAHKGSQLEDLKKAAWYLARKIKRLETHEE